MSRIAAIHELWELTELNYRYGSSNNYSMEQMESILESEYLNLENELTEIMEVLL